MALEQASRGVWGIRRELTASFTVKTSRPGRWGACALMAASMALNGPGRIAMVLRDHATSSLVVIAAISVSQVLDKMAESSANAISMARHAVMALE